nr:protein argonaute-2-like isoform X1 [Onthophagus taurus]XP_022904423.1 protein argonaute-2-like isoform X2 [Onthophagus taurus]
MGKRKRNGNQSRNQSEDNKEQSKAGNSQQQKQDQQLKPIQQHQQDAGRSFDEGKQHQPTPLMVSKPQQTLSADAVQLQCKPSTGDTQQPSCSQHQSIKQVELATTSVDTQTSNLKNKEEQITIKHGGGCVELIEPQLKNKLRQGGTENKSRKIDVLTNHFALKLGKTTAIHYDVNIVPNTPKKFLRQVMEIFRLNHYPDRYPAFDGSKNLYSAYSLCDDTMFGEVKVQDGDRSKEFKVTIKPIVRIDLSILESYFENIDREVGDKPMQALQCLDVILRSGPSLRCIPVGRSFFNTPSGSMIKLGDGTELYNGFYQSVTIGWKPFLNLDIVHKAFPLAINVIDFIEDVLKRANRDNYLNKRDEDVIRKHLKGLKVNYELPKQAIKRAYTINDISKPANQATFKDDSGAIQTVENFFASKRNYKIKYPNWPTLWVGNKTKNIYIPAELCTILSGQVVNKKMSKIQTERMIQETATTAPQRMKKIMESKHNANFNACGQIQEFNITISDKPEEIQARVLQAPTLTYNGNRSVQVKGGVWYGQHFLNKAEIDTWTIISMDKWVDTRDMGELEKCIIQSGKKYGVKFPAATRTKGNFLIIEDRFKPEKTKQKLVDYLENNKYDLTVVIIPDTKMAYSCVKQAAEITVGTLTQCIKSTTLKKLLQNIDRRGHSQSTTDNIVLKINAKLKGVNHVLSNYFRPSILEEPIVIMGADVTHPSPDSQNIPSVAAVTCSYDRNAFKYIFSSRLQEPKLEIIKDLETIVMEQLKFFNRITNRFPQRIVFYRDGVSDGQFREVLSSELGAIRSACSKLNVNYKPKITFFVVQKRHHTRLFPKNPQDSEDKNGNVPVGTCVDKMITRPTFYDFYLVSHASIRGVARPTKYVPLWDDADMSEDEIQELTFYLCHLYARCNRSVSYPAPTYYAHLAAARAKAYIETEQVIDIDKLEELQQKKMVKENISRELPMYFV